MEERTGDLHRQLLLAQSELKAGKEEAQIQEMKHAHLQTQLAGHPCCCAHCLQYPIRFFSMFGIACSSCAEIDHVTRKFYTSMQNLLKPLISFVSMRSVNTNRFLTSAGN